MPFVDEATELFKKLASGQQSHLPNAILHRIGTMGCNVLFENFKVLVWQVVAVEQVFFQAAASNDKPAASKCQALSRICAGLRVEDKHCLWTSPLFSLADGLSYIPGLGIDPNSNRQRPDFKVHGDCPSERIAPLRC